MAGWFGGNLGNIPDQDYHTAKRKRAWWPVRSTLSDEHIWLKHYWRVKHHEVISPTTGSNGVAFSTFIGRLTDEEYLLYSLGQK